MHSPRKRDREKAEKLLRMETEVRELELRLLGDVRALGAVELQRARNRHRLLTHLVRHAKRLRDGT